MPKTRVFAKAKLLRQRRGCIFSRIIRLNATIIYTANELVERRNMARYRYNVKKIAEERIDILFRLAEENAKKGRSSIAKRYVEIARRIGTRCNVRLKKEYKLKICRRCNEFLIPGKNCRVRTLKNRVAITCLACKAVKRFPI